MEAIACVAATTARARQVGQHGLVSLGGMAAGGWHSGARVIADIY
jgi:hypothetical protein